MFQQLLVWFGDESTRVSMAVMLVGALAGAVLWAAGVRLSRTLVALLMVAVGGVGGLILPRHLGWEFNTAASAVVGALVLGAAGLLFQRVWIALLFGLLLAFWAAVSTWLICHGTAAPAFPDGTSTLADTAQAVWSGFPEEIRRPMPLAVCSAFVAGILLAILLPRLVMVTHFALLGASMVLAMLLWAIQSRAMEWPRMLPGTGGAQILLLLGVVAIGAGVQWLLLPIKRSERSRGAREPESAPEKPA